MSRNFVTGHEFGFRHSELDVGCWVLDVRSLPEPAFNAPARSCRFWYSHRFRSIRTDFDLCGGVSPAHDARVALAGLVAIVVYKVLFTGFKTGPGFIGFLSHVKQEWVILANLLCLLLGFAVLSRDFEKSHLPLVLPKYLPHDWKGGFALLGMVWVLSSFL